MRPTASVETFDCSPAVVTPEHKEGEKTFDFSPKLNLTVSAFLENRVKQVVTSKELHPDAFNTWLNQDTFVAILEQHGGPHVKYNKDTNETSTVNIKPRIFKALSTISFAKKIENSQFSHEDCSVFLYYYQFRFNDKSRGNFYYFASSSTVSKTVIETI